MGIGVAIEEHRMKKGLSKRELASMLNVTYQDVSKWENVPNFMGIIAYLKTNCKFIFRKIFPNIPYLFSEVFF